MSQHLSRRAFLETTAAAGALGAAGLCSWLVPSASAGSDFPWSEATIPGLAAAMAAGDLTSRDLTAGYLGQIANLNPLLHAVIEVNPDALTIADRLDRQRRRGLVRGPLHGIPILVKDNIATRDRMQTTAGSLALLNSRVPADADLIARLRNAGAIILGKANLGEWANFRGFISSLDLFGWSARGGITRNPYVLSYTPWGSSSGSAVATTANLCTAAVGTETDGSIVGPSQVNLTVGLKPTLGLISQAGIIPISHNQDTAGPMGRTVTDVAILLGVLQSPFGEVAGKRLPSDYTTFLKRGTLKGARIGVDRRFFDNYDYYGLPGDEDALTLAQNALATMTSLGATLIDVDTGDPYAGYGNEELTALLYEFKAHIAEYLAGVQGTTMRTLSDLIAFNDKHCPQELVYYGQELFVMSEATVGGLSDPTYQAARAFALQSARSAIDTAITNHNLDAIVAPHLTQSTAPAVAGYPNLALPVGLQAGGKPAGMLLYGGFLSEPRLLGLAYDLEQALNVRTPPQFLGEVSSPPNAGLCDSQPAGPRRQASIDQVPRLRIY